MSLIDEIEAAAKQVTISADMPGLVVGNDHDVTAFHFVESPWWTRIKAALEAGQEMEHELHGRLAGLNPELTAAQAKFRGAMKCSDG